MDLPFLALPGKNDPLFITLMRELLRHYIVADIEYSMGEEAFNRLYTTMMDVALYLYWWDNQRQNDGI
jgi:hypothetical protein